MSIINIIIAGNQPQYRKHLTSILEKGSNFKVTTQIACGSDLLAPSKKALIKIIARNINNN